MTDTFFDVGPSSTGGLRIRIRLQPAGSKDAVLGLVQDASGISALKASVTKPPEGGKANAALIKLLAKEWKLAKSTLEVVQGPTSRHKVLHLDGNAQDLAALLNAWTQKKGFDA